MAADREFWPMPIKPPVVSASVRFKPLTHPPPSSPVHPFMVSGNFFLCH